jgi:hypothetical protein
MARLPSAIRHTCILAAMAPIRFGFPEIMAKALSYQCPFCDQQVRVGKPCPGCARKSAKTPPKARKSWETDPSEDGLGLPSDDFDYDDFVAREFGKSPHRQLGVKWYWWVLGIITLLALVFWTV